MPGSSDCQRPNSRRDGRLARGDTSALPHNTGLPRERSGQQENVGAKETKVTSWFHSGTLWGVPSAPKTAQVYSNSETAVACSARRVRISRMPDTRDRATRKMQTLSSAYDVICPATGNPVEN